MATVFEPQKLAWAGVMLVLVEMVALFISISLLLDYTYFLAILVLMLVTTALILLPAFPLKVTFAQWILIQDKRSVFWKRDVVFGHRCCRIQRG